MEEVRQLVQEEGREARNLVAFHVAMDTPARIARKPPRSSAAPPLRRAPPRAPASRLRSASAGRDKRSELRARYWALLFGDLQRAIGEIYNTVEAHENLNECQEVILVLENYTRDFKALGEWFRLKWEYDNTPPPQRPQSLAWEIRKTDFVRPESRRTYSVKSSPSVSGKNSPCLSGHNTPSGKNSPSLTGKVSPGSGKISPRVSSGHSSTSPKANIEFFSSKIVAKTAAKPEPKTAKEISRLTDIKEKDIREFPEENKTAKDLTTLLDKTDSDKQDANVTEVVTNKHSDNTNINKGEIKVISNSKDVKDEKLLPSIEIGKAKECSNTLPKQVVIKSPIHSKVIDEKKNTSGIELSDQAKATIAKLDAMENEFLSEQLIENNAKNDNMINKDIDLRKSEIETVQDVDCSQQKEETSTSSEKDTLTESPFKSEDNFADISSSNSPKSTDTYTSDRTKTPEQIEPNLKITNSVNVISVDVEKTENETFGEVESTSAEVGSKEKVNSNKFEITADIKELSPPHKEIDEKVEVKKDQAKPESKTEIKPNTRPAYSQAAAKPKSVTTRADIKTPIKSATPLTRSKTVVEIRPNTVPKTQRQFPRKNQINKCSYPFNLTTGRTVFETTSSSSNTTNKGAIPKKPLNRNYQMASGDAKPLFGKDDSKKRPPRPTSLKINEKGDKIEKTNIAFEKIKNCEEYSSSDTIVTQIDMSRIESSESLKTLVPDELQTIFDVSNSIEVLNVDNNTNDNEGWLTVKSKRLSRESKKQSKSYWANRFHQPSATTSLPTLNMMESPKLETKPITESPKHAKSDRAYSEQPYADKPEKINKAIKTDKLEITNKPENTDKAEEIKISENPEKSGKFENQEKLEKPEELQKLENLIKSEKLEKPEKSNKLEKPEKLEKLEKLEKSVKVSEKLKSDSNSDNKFKDPSIIRQKSDVTGLKTRSARSKALVKKTEKARDTPEDDDCSDLTKNRLHSSLESLTTGLARSQESTEEVFDFDKWKAEFKFTFNYLDDDDQETNHNEILKAADPTEMSEIAEMTSQIEENEKKLGWALDFQSEVDQRKLCEEEDLLNRQIMELQQVSDIDLDTETDDTETDAELAGAGAGAGADAGAGAGAARAALGELAASLEHQYETALAGLTWAERVDALVALEALVARDPGRAQQLHAKLSQGIKRRGSLQDALRRLQTKQARAEQQRLEYQTERTRKIHQLLARVEEVKVAKNQLIEEKRLRMERRLQKAAENRDQHLKDIVRKAHDEEEKLREIAFIKQLEAENKRHEFLDQCRSHTTRLRQMRRERLNKLEQKAAREAAVGARRQALEAARRLRVASLVERRRQRDARLHQLRELRRRERDTAIREKAEGVRSRLSALAAAAESEARALRSRIRDKQDASRRRLESRLRAVRRRAAAPRAQTTSESQDQSMKEIEEEAERLEQERKEKEKQKAIKKKAKKLKQKLLTTSIDYEELDYNSLAFDLYIYPATNKIYKTITQINNMITPLLETECKETPKQNEQETIEIEEVVKNKRNKKNKNKNVNGEIDHNERSKKSKKKKSAEADVNENSNAANNVKTDFGNDLNEDFNSETKQENNSGKKKKNKKNKDQNDNDKVNKNDKSKLSKTNSVCSSLSDMSKTSARSEKAKVVLDIPRLEKLLNELYRMIEKFDKNSADKLMFQRMNGLKTLSQLLAVASEREDLTSQFTSKCLQTAVSGAWRAAGGAAGAGGACAGAASAAGGAGLLAAPACVHLARLLADRLEKDLQSDPKEMELAKQLCDCLSVALDSVLCATRLYEERKSVGSEEGLAAVRSRAHTLISYLCVCGCITRAEGAGEIRESIQTLLTVSADLCHPCEVDVGSDRQSAMQSLRYALGTGLCGSRAEFCVLFAKGAGLNECGGFVRAARTAHLLRALAEMEHHIVQEAFGEGGWPLEFRAAVARLLSQHAPSDKEAPRTTTLHVNKQRLDQTLSETMVLDLIVLVGFVVVDNPQLQETICDGWSVIKTLCTLPANWLVSKEHSQALLPTLIALSERPSTASAIASELSVTMLEEYLESPEAQKVKLVQVIKQGRAKKTASKK